MFMGIWAYLRHYINLRILYSLSPIAIPWLATLGSTTYNEFATVGSFDLDWDTQQYKCWISQIITFGLLAVLQAVNAFWFFLICRILWRLLITNVAKDERSDDEDELEEEEEEKVEEKKMAGIGNGNAKAPKMIVEGGQMNGTATATGEETHRNGELKARRKR